MTGTVPPGADYKFQFTFHAPAAPGTFDEFYGVVEEGVHWFSDPGQAGPPDNDIEAKIQVVEAQYHGNFVQQSYPTLQQPAIQLVTGQTVEGFIELKNVGTATWKAGETKLATTPRDKPSPVGGPAWLSPTRASTVAADVPPGAIGHFPLELKGGAPGDYTQTFSLVEEAVTWFADAPKGGGPPDNLLAVHVVVGAAPDGGIGAGTGGGGTGTGGGGTGASGTGASGTGTGAGGDAPDGGTQGGVQMKGSCSYRAAGEEQSGGAAAVWLAAAGAVVLGRRRRR